jgi:hypothetical protein
MRLVLALIMMLAPWPALAAKSLALVIGNDDYAHLPDLAKARADARGYADFLADRGYDVTLLTDAGRVAMDEALVAFIDRIEPGDTVAFVFAGHGWSDGRQNFLLPADMRAGGSERLLARESVALRNGVNGVLDEIEARAPALTVAIIDACRNNPFNPADGTRSVGLARGLVQVQAGTGTFVAFSAGEGQTALDRLSDADDAPHSVFTRYFLAELARPQDLQSAFKATQVAVNAAARTVDHPQRPAYYDEVIGPACITGACDAPPPPPTDRDELARLAWADVKESASAEVLEAFAASFPGSFHARLALERVASLLPRPEVGEDVPGLSGWSPPPLLLGSGGLAWDAVATRTVGARLARPRADAPMEAAATRPPGWVPPCLLGEGIAALTICGNTALMAMHAEENAVFRSLFATVTGDDRGSMMIDRRDWLRDRDACGDDRACLTRSYQTRIAILRETDGRGFPTPLHRAQWELNRIGCNAGPVDGRPGGQTRAALRALAENGMVTIPEDRLGAPETLARLAQVDPGACSILTRAALRPHVLTGNWRITASCPADTVFGPSTLTYRLSITRMSDAEVMPEGRATRDARSRRIGALAGRVRSYVSKGGWSVNLWWPNAVPTNMTLLPGDAPERLRGTDSHGCALIAERG